MRRHESRPTRQAVFSPPMCTPPRLSPPLRDFLLPSFLRLPPHSLFSISLLSSTTSCSPFIAPPLLFLHLLSALPFYIPAYHSSPPLSMPSTLIHLSASYCRPRSRYPFPFSDSLPPFSSLSLPLATFSAVLASPPTFPIKFLTSSSLAFLAFPSGFP